MYICAIVVKHQIKKVGPTDRKTCSLNVFLKFKYLNRISLLSTRYNKCSHQQGFCFGKAGKYIILRNGREKWKDVLSSFTPSVSIIYLPPTITLQKYKFDCTCGTYKIHRISIKYVLVIWIAVMVKWQTEDQKQFSNVNFGRLEKNLHKTWKCNDCQHTNYIAKRDIHIFNTSHRSYCWTFCCFCTMKLFCLQSFYFIE